MSDDLTVDGRQVGEQLQVLRLEGLLEVTERARSMVAHPSGRLLDEPLLSPREAEQLVALFDPIAAAVEQAVEVWRLVALQVYRTLEQWSAPLAAMTEAPEVHNATRHLRLVGPDERLDPRAAALRARAARGTGPAPAPLDPRRRRR